MMRNLRITASVDAKRDFTVDNLRDWYTETLLIHSRNRLDPTALSRHDRLRRYGNDAPGKPAFVTLKGLSATTSDVYEAFLQPGDFVRFHAIVAETVKNLYDGVPLEEVIKSAILAARALIEKDPAYSYVTARLLLHTVRREVLGEEVAQEAMAARYGEYFPDFVRYGIEADLLDERLAQFDLPRLARALKPERDLQFNYLGLQTLYDHYFLHHDGRRFELPQAFFMRVAMGLAINEIDREARAIEFYEVLSRASTS